MRDLPPTTLGAPHHKALGPRLQPAAFSPRRSPAVQPTLAQLLNEQGMGDSLKSYNYRTVEW